MTAGTVVVLGEVGLNFGAGMTGGDANLFDFLLLGQLSGRLNHDLVVALEPSPARLTRCARSSSRHARYTGLRAGPQAAGRGSPRPSRFVHVAPRVEATDVGAGAELVAEGAA